MLRNQSSHGTLLAMAICSWLAQGCSDSGRTPAQLAEAGAATDRDSAADVDASACSRLTVWPAGSSSFAIETRSDGPLPVDSGCFPPFATYEFSLAAKTLSSVGCNPPPGQHWDWLIYLTDGEVDAVVSNIGSLSETCAKRCGFPHGYANLVVRDEINGSQTKFSGNLSSAFPECDAGAAGPSPTPEPPFADWQDLWKLTQALDKVLAACGSPESGEPDAGRCVDRRDGGTVPPSAEDRVPPPDDARDAKEEPDVRDAHPDGPEPKHRPSAQPCPVGRGPGRNFPSEAGYVGPGSNCFNDSQCTSGVNGRCLPAGSPPYPAAYQCSYDECASDAGCSPGLACICRTSAQDSTANYCAPAGNCLTDADCGATGYCSFSYETRCPVTSNWGYFCHTPNDQCMTDADCDQSRNCTFDVPAGRWTCSQSDYCPG